MYLISFCFLFLFFAAPSRPSSISSLSSIFSRMASSAEPSSAGSCSSVNTVCSDSDRAASLSSSASSASLQDSHSSFGSGGSLGGSLPYGSSLSYPPPHRNGSDISLDLTPNLPWVWPSSEAARGKLSRVDRVVLEIVETERAYVRDLKSVVEDYLGCIIDCGDLPLKPDEVSTLFCNIEDIYEFNSELLEDLERCCDVAAIAECFVERSEAFDIYTLYCMNYPNSVAVLRDCMKNTSLVGFFRERQTTLSHSLPLETYLLKPVQRILKYHLLLQELAKQFDKSSPGYEIVEEAVISMTAVAWYINDMKRKQEHAIRLQEIESLLLNWPGSDLSGFGELVLEGSFRVQRVRKERAFFLFDKMLLITKKRGDNFIYSTHIFCCNLLLVETLKDPLAFRVSDQTIPKQEHTVQAKNQEEKRLWLHYLKRLIVENQPTSIPHKVRGLHLPSLQFNSETIWKPAPSPRLDDCRSHHRGRRQSEPPEFMYTPEKAKKGFSLLHLDGNIQYRRGRRQSAPAKEIEAAFRHGRVLKHTGSEGELCPSLDPIGSSESASTLASSVIEVESNTGIAGLEEYEEEEMCLSRTSALSITEEILELINQSRVWDRDDNGAGWHIDKVSLISLDFKKRCLAENSDMLSVKEELTSVCCHKDSNANDDSRSKESTNQVSSLWTNEETDKPAPKRERTLTKRDRLLIEKIRNYYEMAEVSNSHFQRRDSISFIPAGLVKHSVSRYNCITKQDGSGQSVIRKMDADEPQASLLVSEPLLRSDLGISNHHDHSEALVSEKKKKLESDSGSNFALYSAEKTEPVAKSRSCAELLEIWKEKEKPLKGIDGNCACRVNAEVKESPLGESLMTLEDDGQQSSIGEAESIDKEAEVKVAEQLPFMVETERKEQSEAHERSVTTVPTFSAASESQPMPKTDADSNPKFEAARVDPKTTAFHVPPDVAGISLRESREGSLIENSDKILSRVQMLARMYSAKVSQRKTPLHKKVWENRGLPGRRELPELWQQCTGVEPINKDIGEQNCTHVDPQVYGHVFIREQISLPCVQENECIISAAKGSFSYIEGINKEAEPRAGSEADGTAILPCLEEHLAAPAVSEYVTSPPNGSPSHTDAPRMKEATQATSCRPQTPVPEEEASGTTCQEMVPHECHTDASLLDEETSTNDIHLEEKVDRKPSLSDNYDSDNEYNSNLVVEAKQDEQDESSMPEDGTYNIDNEFTFTDDAEPQQNQSPVQVAAGYVPASPSPTSPLDTDGLQHPLSTLAHSRAFCPEIWNSNNNNSNALELQRATLPSKGQAMSSASLQRPLCISGHNRTARPYFSASEPNSRIQSPSPSFARLCSTPTVSPSPCVQVPPENATLKAKPPHHPIKTKGGRSFRPISVAVPDCSGTSSAFSTSPCCSPRIISPTATSVSPLFARSRGNSLPFVNLTERSPSPFSDVKKSWGGHRSLDHDLVLDDSQQSCGKSPARSETHLNLSSPEFNCLDWPDFQELQMKSSSSENGDCTLKGAGENTSWEEEVRPPSRSCRSTVICAYVASPQAVEPELLKKSSTLPNHGTGDAVHPNANSTKGIGKASYSTTVNLQIGGSGKIASFSNAQVSLTQTLVTVPESQSIRRINVNSRVVESS
uniref:Pleckstrin homology domain containing, family G (with RhoGef domain) member 2 n=1 Tax=Erpetoichthys calabaricus TaxID=27687 RepID=A0A8C4RBV4_ERPCA